MTLTASSGRSAHPVFSRLAFAGTLFAAALTPVTLSQAASEMPEVETAPALVPAMIAPPVASSSLPEAALDLSPRTDRVLQTSLERCIGKLQLQNAVNGGHLSVALVDITNPLTPSMAQVNGNQMFYAASLPKIAILLGAFEKAAAGKLKLDGDTVAELQRMIRESSNIAASDMLQKVGTDYLATVLQSKRYRLYDSKLNGGLWVGKPYATGNATRRDPLHNLSHGATAYQVARFYYMLETGQLVSPEASRQMKAIMGSPAIHHKFVAGLQSVYPDVKMFRKSGSWRNFHSDSAIVEHDGRRYIAVGLSDDSRGGDWLKSLIVGMDQAVFDSARQQNVATLRPTL